MTKTPNILTAWTLDQSAIHLLHRANQVAELCFVEGAEDTSMTPRQFAVISAVARDPNISQTGLVAATGIDRSTLADLVGRLVKKGLLARRRCRHDARAYAIRLTPEAVVLFDRLSSQASRADERLLDQLPQRERTQLIEILTSLVQGAEARLREGSATVEANGDARREQPAAAAP